MKRYFMTIPEAVILVLQASSMGSGGDTFVLNMGQQVRILDLAEDLIRLSGLEPYKDVDIVYTGIRPGEKLSEDLWEEGTPTNPPSTLRSSAWKPAMSSAARICAALWMKSSAWLGKVKPRPSCACSMNSSPALISALTPA